jgi:hypothetical protein
MARVELRRDLNAVAARQAGPAVRRLADALADETRDRAPAAKVWLSRDDERVRPAHVRAHGQTIPANLRFKLRRQLYDGDDETARAVALAAGYDLAVAPRDEALPIGQRARCRCVRVTLLGVIARRVTTSEVTYSPSQARAQVAVRFARIVESEFGTPDDRAARFMGRALEVVAARLKASARRL